MNAQKTVVVLGGGTGGIVAARGLRRRLPKSWRVALIEREATYTFAPSFLWLMLGWRKPHEIQRPLARLARKGIEVLREEAAAIFPQQQIIRTKNQDVSYDYLVISLGAELAPEKIEDLAESGCNLYALDGAEHLREELTRFPGGRIAVVISSLPFKCPAAPYEAAFLIEAYMRKRNIREKTELAVFTPEPLPMPVAGPENGKKVKALLEERGIRFFPEHELVRVDHSQKTLHFKSGDAAAFDLLIFVPPHRGTKVIRESNLGNETGWIPVDPRTLRTANERIWAIGDAALILLAMGKPLPKAGVFAHRQAEVVARNIAAEAMGQKPKAAFDGHGSCFLEAGDGGAGFASGDFYATPTPRISLRPPSRLWHLGKIAFEKYWLWRAV